jgi:benzylsuccinate CoA-transferase BbsE subunit
MHEHEMAPDWLREFDWKSYDPNRLSGDQLERLEAAFAAFFATRSRRELYDEALKRRILLAPCNDAREILDHPQLRDRGLFVTIDYPELGARVEHPGFFARIDPDAAEPGMRVRRAPRLGEHNQQILGPLGLESGQTP